MKLSSFKIKNYRSIDEVAFEIKSLNDGSFTYGLIGVNEVGKSTILKALALDEGLKNEKGEPLPLAKDFRDKTKKIEIEYFYSLEKPDIQEIKENLSSSEQSIDTTGLNFSQIKLSLNFEISSPSRGNYTLEFLNIPEEEQRKSTTQERLKDFVFEKSHRPIFWTAEDRYLISQPINLVQFAEKPDEVSIPLRNCFNLAGISNIKDRIGLLLGDSTEVEQLQNELGTKVTEHINTVWSKHPIEITFLISDGLINFHIKDLGSKGKAKTADQRSDGFKQFISFLLTVSAESKNEELTNAILLLDEPETHLHPQAQEDLLKELINITKNKRNNIAFFATHSNYMIDKGDLARNYKIKKPKDITEKEQFDSKISTYASVTYEVFDIPSTDYHNELYSKLHEIYQDGDLKNDLRERILNFDTEYLNAKKGLKKDKPWKGSKNTATLPTYVRNCIHHPDNGDKYTTAELRESLEHLLKFLAKP